MSTLYDLFIQYVDHCVQDVREYHKPQSMNARESDEVICILLCAMWSNADNDFNEMQRCYGMYEQWIRPRHLLKINGKPLLEHWADKIKEERRISDVYFTTTLINHDAISHWAENNGFKRENVVCNGEASIDESGGACRDIAKILAIHAERKEGPPPGILIMCGDSFCCEEFSLSSFFTFRSTRGCKSVILSCRPCLNPDVQYLQRRIRTWLAVDPTNSLLTRIFAPEELFGHATSDYKSIKQSPINAGDEATNEPRLLRGNSTASSNGSIRNFTMTRNRLAPPQIVTSGALKITSHFQHSSSLGGTLGGSTMFPPAPMGAATPIPPAISSSTNQLSTTANSGAANKSALTVSVPPRRVDEVELQGNPHTNVINLPVGGCMPTPALPPSSPSCFNGGILPYTCRDVEKSSSDFDLMLGPALLLGSSVALDIRRHAVEMWGMSNSRRQRLKLTVPCFLQLNYINRDFHVISLLGEMVYLTCDAVSAEQVVAQVRYAEILFNKMLEFPSLYPIPSPSEEMNSMSAVAHHSDMNTGNAASNQEFNPNRGVSLNEDYNHPLITHREMSKPVSKFESTCSSVSTTEHGSSNLSDIDFLRDLFFKCGFQDVYQLKDELKDESNTHFRQSVSSGASFLPLVQEAYVGRAFARASLLGAPSDRFYGSVLCCTLEGMSTEVMIWPNRDEVLFEPNLDMDRTVFYSGVDLCNSADSVGVLDGIRTVIATTKRFFQHCMLCGIILPPRKKFRVTFSSTIPRHIGLGSSSALSIATLRALCSYFGIFEGGLLLPKEVLAGLAFATGSEELAARNTIQDSASQVYEGLLIMTFQPQTENINPPPKKSELVNRKSLTTNATTGHRRLVSDVFDLLNMHIAFDVSFASKNTMLINKLLGIMRNKFELGDTRLRQDLQRLSNIVHTIANLVDYTAKQLAAIKKSSNISGRARWMGRKKSTTTGAAENFQTESSHDGFTPQTRRSKTIAISSTSEKNGFQDSSTTEEDKAKGAADKAKFPNINENNIDMRAIQNIINNISNDQAVPPNATSSKSLKSSGTAYFSKDLAHQAAVPNDYCTPSSGNASQIEYQYERLRKRLKTAFTKVMYESLSIHLRILHNYVDEPTQKIFSLATQFDTPCCFIGGAAVTLLLDCPSGLVDALSQNGISCLPVAVKRPTLPDGPRFAERAFTRSLKYALVHTLKLRDVNEGHTTWNEKSTTNLIKTEQQYLKQKDTREGQDTENAFSRYNDNIRTGAAFGQEEDRAKDEFEDDDFSPKETARRRHDFGSPIRENYLTSPVNSEDVYGDTDGDADDDATVDSLGFKKGASIDLLKPIILPAVSSSAPTVGCPSISSSIGAIQNVMMMEKRKVGGMVRALRLRDPHVAPSFTSEEDEFEDYHNYNNAPPQPFSTSPFVENEGANAKLNNTAANASDAIQTQAPLPPLPPPHSSFNPRLSSSFPSQSTTHSSSPIWPPPPQPSPPQLHRGTSVAINGVVVVCPNNNPSPLSNSNHSVNAQIGSHSPAAVQNQQLNTLRSFPSSMADLSPAKSDNINSSQHSPFPASTTNININPPPQSPVEVSKASGQLAHAGSGNQLHLNTSLQIGMPLISSTSSTQVPSIPTPRSSTSAVVADTHALQQTANLIQQPQRQSALSAPYPQHGLQLFSRRSSLDAAELTNQPESFTKGAMEIMINQSQVERKQEDQMNENIDDNVDDNENNFIYKDLEYDESQKQTQHLICRSRHILEHETPLQQMMRKQLVAAVDAARVQQNQINNEQT